MVYKAQLIVDDGDGERLADFRFDTDHIAGFWTPQRDQVFGDIVSIMISGNFYCIQQDPFIRKHLRERFGKCVNG